jgi:hypothetical protein
VGEESFPGLVAIQDVVVPEPTVPQPVCAVGGESCPSWVVILNAVVLKATIQRPVYAVRGESYRCTEPCNPRNNSCCRGSLCL